ncbi:MAG TPA: hypothetical protein VGT08_19905 [Terracidiphilus sp.]|nr:hypothetical protein [Terracidiphilus sp.]
MLEVRRATTVIRQRLRAPAVVSEWRVKTDIVNVDAGSVVGMVFNLFHKFSTKSVFGFKKY